MRLHCPDPVSNLHSFRDLPEYAISVSLLSVIEEMLIDHVDEKLGRGAVHILCPGHGNGAALVLQTIGGLADYRRFSILFRHVGGKPAALYHEIRYDAVKCGAVIKFIVHVQQEILL